MRSSVIDKHRPLDVVQKDPRYEHLYQSRPPYNKHSQRIPRRMFFSSLWHRLVPQEGWTPLLLLALALYSVISSIIAAKWVSHSNLLFACPFVGLLAGLIIAKSLRLPQAMLHLAACLVGYWLAVWLTCAQAFHIPMSLLLGSIHAALLGGVTASALPANDVVFFFYLAFLCFFLAYFGCWLVYRAHLPWLVALVYGSIMLVNLNYTQPDSYYLVVILVAALILLIARLQLVVQLSQWTRDGLYTDQSWRRMMTWRCMQASCVMLLLTLVSGWLLPIQAQPTSGKAVWDGIDNSITNIANGHISWRNPTSLIQPYQPTSNYFSDQLTVTGKVQLPSGVVLLYTSSAGPRYLEGSTFNVFDGHTWTSTVTEAGASDYNAGERLPIDTGNTGSGIVTLHVTMLQPPGGTKAYLFAPAQPMSFNVASRVYSDGTAGAWTQQKPVARGETYVVTSLEPSTDKNVLANVPLPQRNVDIWQRDTNYNQLALHYTQIPSRLSPLVQQTTADWTRGATDTYSALKDLESHLNDPKTFTYAVDNTPVPTNIDVATWLLQTRRGYCTYFASAMVVMARLMGIPTRLVTGFSQGTLNEQQNEWSVLGSDAHSWVQAYFPSVGWVNFDPTPGYAPGAAPVQKSLAAPQMPLKQPTVPPAQAVKKFTPVAQPSLHKVKTAIVAPDSADNRSLWVALLIGGAVLLLLLSGVVYARRWWHNLYAQSPFATGKFWRLCWLAGLCGLAPKKWQTPYEYGKMLSRHFPQHSLPLWRLTDLFVRERWGASYQAPCFEEKSVVTQFWPSLQRMFLQKLWRHK